MREFKPLLKSNSFHLHGRQSEEARLLALYSTWHETNDLNLKARFFNRLVVVLRRIPNFDLKRRFKQAF
ncbi:MAG: hypothetical protein HY583_00965 [Candidatus Omnitrophica bacterium]|nr:hypothetical protein [Candidatus Omnitrophota bacterium]